MVENILLRNKRTNATLELDRVTTPYYILDSIDWGVVEGTHHQYKYVNQVGVYVTGTSLGTRDVEISGWIIANTENQMTDRKSMLNRFVNPQQEIEVKYKEYLLSFLPDSSIKYSTTIVDNNEVICKFKISGMCADPLFKIENDSRIAGASTHALFHFPLMLGAVDNGFPVAMFGLREPSLIIDVYNEGAIGTGMKIVFKALGTLQNPSLISVETQEYFKINKTMYAGETIEINTNIGEKKIIAKINGQEINYFKYRDLDSTWLQLNTGDNLFRYDADAGLDNLEVYIYFSNKYLEVQECY